MQHRPHKRPRISGAFSREGELPLGVLERRFRLDTGPPRQSSFWAELDFLTHKTVISIDVALFSRSSMVE
jgi:hypothetical protein